MTPEEIQPIARMSAQLVMDELRPILLDYVRSIASPLAQGLTPKEKAERRAAKRKADDLAGEKSAEVFRAERFYGESHDWAPLTRTHEQYKAFCYHRDLTPLGRTKFDKWLMKQGYQPRKPGTVKMFMGFMVKPDPEIDPTFEFEPDVPPPIDERFVKIAKAARRAGLHPKKVHEMIAMRMAETKDVGLKYPKVFLPDVLTHADAFKPEPPVFKKTGSYSEYMDERTEKVRGVNLDCRMAYSDYEVWCANRDELPIQYTRFREAVGKNHQVGPHNKKPMSFYNLAFKSNVG